MALNFTSYSAFRSDDDFGSMVWDSSVENCGNHGLFTWEKNDLYENGLGRDWIDPIYLLPADPFGMELSSNIAAAIIGWFEDLGSNSNNCKVYSMNNGKYKNDIHDWFGDGLAGFGSVRGDKSEEDPPHEGLMLALGYLGVQDLLSVERVCRTLHSAVQNDPLLWRCIHIDSPLSERLTDDALLRLARRAQGSLQCLSLVGCRRITDEGLKKVLESNPRLQKLSVIGCVRLSVEGLINNLKAFKSSYVAGIEHLKLGGLFSVLPEQFEELQMLLGCDKMSQPKPSKPRFYHCGVSSIACEDDRAIDIEMCPGCQKFKVVFDCPSESCQGKGLGNCRACDVCIERCVQCGRCFNDCRFVENFLLENVCSACWKQAQEE